MGIFAKKKTSALVRLLADGIEHDPTAFANVATPRSQQQRQLWRVIGEIQERLDCLVTLHVQGSTWEGPPSIGVELPLELFERIAADNADALEAELRRFRDRIVSILADAKAGEV